MSKIPVPYSTDDFDLLLESAIKSCTNSGTTSMYERNGFATTHRENVTFLNAGKNILTVMVFGKPTNLSSLEGNGMEKSLSLIVAKSQPGIDPDEAVIEEIVSIAPTHIIFFQESGNLSDFVLLYFAMKSTKLRSNDNRTIGKRWTIKPSRKRSKELIRSLATF